MPDPRRQGLPLGRDHRIGCHQRAGCRTLGQIPKEAWDEFYRSGGRSLPDPVRRRHAQDPDGGWRNCLRRWAIPQGTDTGDDGYEDHRTFRPSEYGVQRPRGGLIYSLAVESGDVFFARTRRGGGTTVRKRTNCQTGWCETSPLPARLDAAYDDALPNTSTRPPRPATGCSGGRRGWEVDTESYRRPYAHGSTTTRPTSPDCCGLARPWRRVIRPHRSPSPCSNPLASCASAVILPARRPTTSTGFAPLTARSSGVSSLAGWCCRNAIARPPDRRDVRGGRQAERGLVCSGGHGPSCSSSTPRRARFAAPST